MTTQDELFPLPPGVGHVPPQRRTRKDARVTWVRLQRRHVLCDDCVHFAHRTGRDGRAVHIARWKRAFDGALLFLCDAHAARRKDNDR